MTPLILMHAILCLRIFNSYFLPTAEEENAGLSDPFSSNALHTVDCLPDSINSNSCSNTVIEGSFNSNACHTVECSPDTNNSNACLTVIEDSVTQFSCMPNLGRWGSTEVRIKSFAFFGCLALSQTSASQVCHS